MAGYAFGSNPPYGLRLRDSKNVKTNIVIQAALDLVKTKVKTRDG
jgi:hypothetical protein